MAELPLDTQVPVRFVPDFACTDQTVTEIHNSKPETRWCLLELPKDQLEALEKGASFYFQSQAAGTGLNDGGAALCTSTATFSVEFLENSNSQFVASIGEVPIADIGVIKVAEAKADTAEAGEVASEPKSDAGGAKETASEPKEGASEPKENAGETKADSGPTTRLQADVFGQVRGQMIVKPVKVNKSRLQELLAAQALGSDVPLDASGQQPQMLSKHELAYQVAASPTELQAMLEEGPYAEVDGCWRLLPSSLEHEIIGTTASLVTAKGWNAEDINGEHLLQEVQQHVSQQSVPSLAVLRKALRTVALVQEPKDSKQGEDKPESADAAATQATSQAAEAVATDTVAETPSGDVAPKDPNNLALDKAKLDRFHVMQLLRRPPAEVRDRFQLPAPEPRAKRPRLGAGAGRGSDGLQLQELGSAVQAISGAEERPADDKLMEMLGDSAYIDELEGTVHNLPVSMLPPEPRARLSSLLELTSHWRPERLTALITPALPAGIKVATWLLKNTRAVHVELEPGKEVRMLTKKFGM